MRVSYGMPALAYASFERTQPLVRRMSAPFDITDYGELEIMDGFGDYGVVATSRNLARLRRKLAKAKRSLRSAKRAGQKRRWSRRVKRLQAKIQKLIAKGSKQIARRRRKGRKLRRRLTRLQSSSPALQTKRKRRFQGKTSTPPFWFMRGAAQSVRQNMWSTMSKAQRKAARMAFRKRRRAMRQRRQQQQQGSQMRPDFQTMFPAPPDGFQSQSAFDSGMPSSTTGQDLVAMPDFEDSSSSDDDFDTEEVGDDFETEDAGGTNRNVLIGVGLVGAAAIAFLVMRKKKPTTKGRKPGRAR